jgi:glycerol kinase
MGLAFDSGVAQIARATLEAVCYQTHDLLTSMTADGATKPAALRVDGGMIENAWLVQFLADILDVTVDRPKVGETTALGAAFLAGLHTGIYQSLEDIATIRQVRDQFSPCMQQDRRTTLIAGWKSAVARVASNS